MSVLSSMLRAEDISSPVILDASFVSDLLVFPSDVVMDCEELLREGRRGRTAGVGVCRVLPMLKAG